MDNGDLVYNLLNSSQKVLLDFQCSSLGKTLQVTNMKIQK